MGEQLAGFPFEGNVIGVETLRAVGDEDAQRMAGDQCVKVRLVLYLKMLGIYIGRS